jgi:hypothetical protein
MGNIKMKRVVFTVPQEDYDQFSRIAAINGDYKASLVLRKAVLAYKDGALWFDRFTPRVRGQASSEASKPGKGTPHTEKKPVDLTQQPVLYVSPSGIKLYKMPNKSREECTEENPYYLLPDGEPDFNETKMPWYQAELAKQQSVTDDAAEEAV